MLRTKTNLKTLADFLNVNILIIEKSYFFIFTLVDFFIFTR